MKQIMTFKWIWRDNKAITYYFSFPFFSDFLLKGGVDCKIRYGLKCVATKLVANFGIFLNYSFFLFRLLQGARNRLSTNTQIVVVFFQARGDQILR